MIIEILSAFFGCFGITLVFHLYKDMKLTFVSCLIGSIGWSIYLLTDFYNNPFLQSFIAMCIVALLAEISARIFKAPAIVFTMIGFFPLVPGKGIYDTMLHAISGEHVLFVSSFLETLGISIALALGILTVSTVFHIYKKIKLLSK